MSNSYHLPIQKIETVGPNIRHLVFDRPKEFHHSPGQAVLFELTSEGSEEEPSPFSPVSLPDDENLEFFIKIYPKRDGLTDAMGDCAEGDVIKIGEPWGDIQYKGPGTFLAAGTGITPFLGIIRYLGKSNQTEGNRLYYVDSQAGELIAKGELDAILGEEATFLISGDESDPRHGRLDRDFLESEITNFGDQYFYVCGPPSFVKGTLDFLRSKGVRENYLIYEGMSDG